MKDKMFCITLEEPKKLVLHEKQVPKPGKDEVLIQVKRVGLCGSDATIYYGKHPYVNYPVVMGHEFSGIIEALGEGVNTLSAGARVAVIPHLVCGSCRDCMNEIFNFCEQLRCTGAEADGAYCEYIVMPAKMVLPIPDTLSLDDAALIEPACVAYHAAKRGEITHEDMVLIVGAGPIGNFCMQSAKALGAKKVFIADVDKERLDLALKSGADGIIHIPDESIAEGVNRLAGSPKEIGLYFDCVGGKGEVFNQILLLASRGSRIVFVGVLQKEYNIPNLPDFVQHELRISGTTMYVPKDYQEMIVLMDKKIIRTDGMVTHYFDLKDVVSVFKNLVENKTEKYFKVMFKA